MIHDFPHRYTWITTDYPPVPLPITIFTQYTLLIIYKAVYMVMEQVKSYQQILDIVNEPDNESSNDPNDIPVRNWSPEFTINPKR